MKHKKRLVYNKIIEHIDHKNALVITGMRQVGKTTVMKQVYESLDDKPKIWFDFDNPLDQKVFEDIDYNNIFDRLKSQISPGVERFFVFIDEIQNYPEVTKVIKYLMDHYNIKFIVTGSSNYYLRNLFPESLSGRKFLYQLDPLSFQEYLYFNDLVSRENAMNHSIDDAVGKHDIVEYKKYQQHYENYIRYGGFPEVVLTKSISLKKDILGNILISFFEKDIKILQDYSNVKELRDLILLLVPRVGSQIDISKISSELGIARKKVYSYLELLEGIFFISLVSKHANVDRSVAGGKKVYFNDTGLLNYLGGVNDADIFENAVFNQLSRYGKVQFYNKRNIKEIDFILDLDGQRKIALDAKLTGTEEYVNGLSKIAKSLGIENSYIISKSYREEENLVFPQFI